MESQNFGHEHPLVFSEDQPSNQSEDQAAHHCSRCGEAIISGPSFGCEEEYCGFYLHKQCAEAPSQLNHPFHPNHPLSLHPNPPSIKGYKRGFICKFCGERGKMFVYRCSCNIDLHIKCALLTYNMGGHKNFREYQLKHVDPLVATENYGIQQLKSVATVATCFMCWEPLFDPICGFNLHKKCAELSFQIDYSGHRKHPLTLQFTAKSFSSCVLCDDKGRAVGFCYRCSSCKYVIHIPCLSSLSVIKNKGHPHPFTLFLRRFPYTCDACGVKGNEVPYMCSQCNLLLHKKCISLPRIIKHAWHEHPIIHTYSVRRHESKHWKCIICLDEVNTEHGSYNCLDCDFFLHVKCALREKDWYSIIELENEDEKLGANLALSLDVSSFIVIERNEVGEALKIKHFSHIHDLVLGEKIVEDDIYCDGCTLVISDLVYYCSKCKFFLHKICAEFPKKKHKWGHKCQQSLALISDCIFKCVHCGYVCNGFAYKCDKCKDFVCLRCMIPYALTHQGHEHPLSYYVKLRGHCNACGDYIHKAFCCKECHFALEWHCLLLPQKAPHKCDKHLLTLAYKDDNYYSKSHFCDICEEDRDPTHWFYHCSICDNSTHLYCLVGKYLFIKLGKIYKDCDHPHPVTFVKKVYYYPTCIVCGKPCEDLALECGESGCGYIVHWECIAPSELWVKLEDES